jgi:hypothetical protein
VNEQQQAKPSLLKRLLAVIVLVIAGFILLKLVLHVLAGVAIFIVAILAIVAVVWAMRTL